MKRRHFLGLMSAGVAALGLSQTTTWTADKTPPCRAAVPVAAGQGPRDLQVVAADALRYFDQALWWRTRRSRVLLGPLVGGLGATMGAYVITHQHHVLVGCPERGPQDHVIAAAMESLAWRVVGATGGYRAFAIPPVPEGVDCATAVLEHRGLAMRAVRMYDILLDEWLVRFDVVGA